MPVFQMKLVYKKLNSTLNSMKKSVTQEFDYGCGIACYAFVRGISYKQAEYALGEKQAKSERFWVRDLARALNESGLEYQHKYVKQHVKPLITAEGTIVLIGRSAIYPVGHYLARHNGKWMDPWINLPRDQDIHHAISGFRETLPGTPKYAILPSAARPVLFHDSKPYSQPFKK